MHIQSADRRTAVSSNKKRPLTERWVGVFFVAKHWSHPLCSDFPLKLPLRERVFQGKNNAIHSLRQQRDGKCRKLLNFSVVSSTLNTKCQARLRKRPPFSKEMQYPSPKTCPTNIYPLYLPQALPCIVQKNHRAREILAIGSKIIPVAFEIRFAARQ